MIKSNAFETLIIGDIQIENEPLSDYLAKQFPVIHKAENAQQALSADLQNDIDLIFLDVDSPDFDGYKLLSDLRTTYRGRHIVAVLSSLEFEKAARCLEMGADEYVFKPLHKTILTKRLDTFATVQGIGEFFALMAHDLLVPITNMKGFTDLLLANIVGEINEQQAQFLTTINKNAEQAAKLIRNFNDMVKIDTKQIRLIPKNIVLQNLLEETLKPFEKLFAAKHQAVHRLLAENLPMMWSDDFRLSQILIALIENAHQYTPDGGNIIISAEEIADGKRRLIKVAIRNEGKGILPSEESQLFMPFFLSEQEQTRERYGTGLNLYIAKNIVELQGGEMTFENCPGNGMTFYFTVPTNQ